MISNNSYGSRIDVIVIDVTVYKIYIFFERWSRKSQMFLGLDSVDVIHTYMVQTILLASLGDISRSLNGFSHKNVKAQALDDTFYYLVRYKAYLYPITRIQFRDHLTGYTNLLRPMS
jgi:hypothetical protein